jgi:hypothetical protein
MKNCEPPPQVLVIFGTAFASRQLRHLVMNLFRLFRNVPQHTTARVCNGRIARSKATAIETLRRFQDGKLNERDSEAIIDALLRFNEGSLTEEELVDIAAAIGQKP